MSEEEKKEETKEVNKLEKLKESVLKETPQQQIEILINKAKAHITSVKEFVLKYHGKPNYNPYTWLRDKGFTAAETMLKNPGLFNSSDVITILNKVLQVKAEPPVVMHEPIMERAELNKQIEKDKENKKK